MRLTTIIDLVGCLFVAAGAALFVAQWSMPGALGLLGASILGLSWLVDRKGHK